METSRCGTSTVTEWFTLTRLNMPDMVSSRISVRVLLRSVIFEAIYLFTLKLLVEPS